MRRLISAQELEILFEKEKLGIVQVKPMGGRYVIIRFPSEDRRNEILKEKWLELWFEEVNPWNGESAKNERFVWIACFGMPLNAWNGGRGGNLQYGNLDTPGFKPRAEEEDDKVDKTDGDRNASSKKNGDLMDDMKKQKTSCSDDMAKHGDEEAEKVPIELATAIQAAIQARKKRPLPPPPGLPSPAPLFSGSQMRVASPLLSKVQALSLRISSLL
ncbi:hypothetical protein RHSIM_Rhsim08G0091100 [Rhododendron simsii]|uniref:DUF4283 domain-containing protein n=1 Tax=Rhododendron simsii TaxID=118357 RepID=A0A834GMN2_RHOSS|nr:hypothetical protein RHSIM_Rhsim08G0091100 [Rhododendron simsii]